MDADFERGKFPIEYENSKVIEHKIYSAEWSLLLQPIKINALFIDLSYEELNWILLLENNNFSFLFKFVDGEYSILDKSGKLMPVEYTASLVSNFEKMINLGFGWTPQEKSNELIKIIINNI